jgi:hypothetical protein
MAHQLGPDRVRCWHNIGAARSCAPSAYARQPLMRASTRPRRRSKSEVGAEAGLQRLLCSRSRRDQRLPAKRIEKVGSPQSTRTLTLLPSEGIKIRAVQRPLLVLAQALNGTMARRSEIGLPRKSQILS